MDKNYKQKLLIGASILAINFGAFPSLSIAQTCPGTAQVDCLDHKGQVVAPGSAGYTTYCTTTPLSDNRPSDICNTAPCSGDGGGGCCFIAGTKIVMADGSEKNIEDIIAGDEVVGFDNAIQTVLEKRDTTLQDRSLIAINGGSYFATCDHTFKTKDGWASADPEMTQKHYADVIEDIGGLPSQMDVGTELCGQNSHTTISTLEFKHDHPDLVLYDLHVTGDHTYLANSFIVHNAGEPSCPPETDPGDGSVLCGFFFSKGILSYNIYKGDIAFTNQYVDDVTKRGYRFWAVPLTQYLNNNPNGLVEKIVEPFVVSWATEMAYQTRYHSQGHWLGKLQLTLLKPLVHIIGKFVEDTNWTHLSSERSILKQRTLAIASIY